MTASELQAWLKEMLPSTPIIGKYYERDNEVILSAEYFDYNKGYRVKKEVTIGYD